MRFTVNRPRLRYLGVVVVVVAVLAVVYTVQVRSKPPAVTPRRKSPALSVPDEDKVHIATAACEPHELLLLQQLLKSALFSSQHVLSLYVFAPPHIQTSLAQKVLDWPFAFARKLEVRLYNPHVPEGWQGDSTNLQLLCDVQPFVLTKSLPHLERVVWMNVDTLFTAPVEAVWDFFRAIEPIPRVVVACTQDTAPDSRGMVTVKGPRTEVMLLRLREMRQKEWATPLLADLRNCSPRTPEFREVINRHFLSPTNIYSVYWLPCNMNFGAELCPSTLMCEKAKANGAVVLRGAASNTDPVFTTLLEAFTKFRLGVDCNKKLPYFILQALTRWPNSTCAFRPDMYVKQLNAFIARLSLHMPDIHCVP